MEICYDRKAKNGLRITVTLVLSEGSAQTGMIVVTGGDAPRRVLLFSTPNAAIRIAEAMRQDWDGEPPS